MIDNHIEQLGGIVERPDKIWDALALNNLLGDSVQSYQQTIENKIQYENTPKVSFVFYFKNKKCKL